jgi:transcriptional regulator with XRE-family HTH domain
MVIGERLRESRQRKSLSQGEIEKRTGLLRCYVSRVENGHTVPSRETLEKLARAFAAPMYRIFYDGDGPPKPSSLSKSDNPDDTGWGTPGRDAKLLRKFRRSLGRANEANKKVLMFMAQKMARSAVR